LVVVGLWRWWGASRLWRHTPIDPAPWPCRTYTGGGVVQLRLHRDSGGLRRPGLNLHLWRASCHCFPGACALVGEEGWGRLDEGAPCNWSHRAHGGCVLLYRGATNNATTPSSTPMATLAPTPTTLPISGKQFFIDASSYLWCVVILLFPLLQYYFLMWVPSARR
jgi:hypothetical protein